MRFTHSLRFRLALSGSVPRVVKSDGSSKSPFGGVEEKLGSGRELPILRANGKPSPF